MFERNKKDARYQKNHVVGMFIRLSCASSYNDGDFIISVQRYKDFLRNANDCCKNFQFTWKCLYLFKLTRDFTDAPHSLHWLLVRVFFCISMTRVARWERVVGEGREKKKSLTSTVRLECSCGDTTRTCDLQVMSLASYQLLHSAMYLLIIGRSLMFQKRMQRYGEFLICANFFLDFFTREGKFC